MRKINNLPNKGTNNNEVILNNGELSYYNNGISYNYNIDTELVTLLSSFNKNFNYTIEYNNKMNIEEDK